jgi:hypothetical protein
VAQHRGAQRARLGDEGRGAHQKPSRSPGNSDFEKLPTWITRPDRSSDFSAGSGARSSAISNS